MPPNDTIIEDAQNKQADSQSTVGDEVYLGSGRPKSLKSLSTRSLVSIESLPDEKNHEDFIRKSVDILITQAVFGATKRANKVLEWTSPEEMMKKIDFNLYRTASTHEDLQGLLQDTIKYSVKTGHPYFVNQLFSSVDPYGLVGQWLTDALNPSVYTYEVSPVFTLMEEVVLREMRSIVGFENGRGDGIFCPGGSIANGYAISCARYKYMPDIKVGGYFL